MKLRILMMFAALCCASVGETEGVLSRYQRLTKAERLSIRKEKIDRFLLPAMRDAGVDCWVIMTREYVQDPVEGDLGAGSPTARAAMIFTDEGDRLGRLGVFASYDTDAPTRAGIYDRIISYKSEGLLPHLQEFFQTRKPKRVAVNISKDSPLADGLTVSMLEYLMTAAGPGYDRERFVSAEPVVVSWRGRRTKKEIEILRIAVQATEEIIAEIFNSRVVQPGKTTERELAELAHRKMEERNVTASWEPDHCPSINTGISRGHSRSGDNVIHPGDVLTIDFGINLDGYVTDVQRTAYVLRPGETGPPVEVKKMWETNRKAVEAGFAVMQPGKTGHDVDTAARKVVVDAGYKEYPYGTGHPIGYITHEVGPALGPDWPERYGKKVFLKLEPGQVFALEPAVFVDSKERGGEIRIGIEEDVLITENGPEWLTTPQTELILIGGVK